MVADVKVGKKAVRVVFIGLAILILINIMARFNLFDFTASSANILTIIGALFLLAEVGIMKLVRSTPSGTGAVINWLIAIVALLALLTSGLGLVGITIAALTPIQGIVDIGLLIFIIIEIFR